MRVPIALAFALLLGAAGGAAAQPALSVPEPSPKASVSQTVGLTEITLRYHRPAVAGRKIWGELVPYGEVWRAGANDNTTITFSTPVKVGGRPLAAGTYGLHMLPTPKDWTVILSTVSTMWGSYGYNQKEDALRVTVTPQPAEHVERLAFTFDDPTDKSVDAVLRWEKLKVAIPIQVDTPAVVMASMRAELRGAAQFSAQAWNRAARYWLENGGNLDEALRLSDRAMKGAPSYPVFELRSRLLAKKGDAKGAAAMHARALKAATEADLNNEGYALLQQKKVDEAVALFQQNAKDHPDSWNAHDSLGEALLLKGDKDGAAAAYGRALALVKDDPDNRKRIERVLARLGGK